MSILTLAQRVDVERETTEKHTYVQNKDRILLCTSAYSQKIAYRMQK